MNSDYLDPDHWVNGGECSKFYHPEAEAVQSLMDEIESLKAESKRLRDAFAKYDEEITQVLGAALNFPKYNGVTCVADRTAEDLAEQAVNEINSLRDKLRWIPVEERLPEKDIATLVMLKNKSKRIEWHIGGGKWTTGATITHWMPIPEVPK